MRTSARRPTVRLARAVRSPPRRSAAACQWSRRWLLGGAGRRNAEIVAVSFGCIGKDVVERQRRPRLVEPEDVHDRERMRRRRHVREIELGHLADGGEDVVQLDSESRDLLLAQLELGERRDMEHIFPGDCHALNPPKKRRGPLSGASLFTWFRKES